MSHALLIGLVSAVYFVYMYIDSNNTAFYTW